MEATVVVVGIVVVAAAGLLRKQQQQRRRRRRRRRCRDERERADRRPNNERASERASKREPTGLGEPPPIAIKPRHPHSQTITPLPPPRYPFVRCHHLLRLHLLHLPSSAVAASDSSARSYYFPDAFWPSRSVRSTTAFVASFVRTFVRSFVRSFVRTFPVYPQPRELVQSARYCPRGSRVADRASRQSSNGRGWRAALIPENQKPESSQQAGRLPEATNLPSPFLTLWPFPVSVASRPAEGEKRIPGCPGDSGASRGRVLSQRLATRTTHHARSHARVVPCPVARRVQPSARGVSSARPRFTQLEDTVL